MKEGVKIYTTDVVTENIEFAESKAAAQNGNNKAQDDEFMNVEEGLTEEGLPF